MAAYSPGRTNTWICYIFLIVEHNGVHSVTFGPPSLTWRVLWNRVCRSFRPSFHLFGHFRGIVSLVFSKFWHDARNQYEVVRDRAGFSRKKMFAPKIGKVGQKQGLLNIVKNFVIIFLLNLLYNESVYYLLYPCTNPTIFGKILVPQIWTKMFSTNQITGSTISPEQINEIARFFYLLIQIHMN